MDTPTAVVPTKYLGYVLKSLGKKKQMKKKSMQGAGAHGWGVLVQGV